MSNEIITTSRWMYKGFWGVLSKWFMVPREAPELPVSNKDNLLKFKPSQGWLNYHILHYWVGNVVSLVVTAIICTVLIVALPFFGLILGVLFVVFMLFRTGMAYLALYLRYDTTWYVLSDSSLRLRRGIWLINEMTISFDNIQNLSIKQGPLQRYFNIYDLHIQTAGGSSVPNQEVAVQTHQAVIEGVSNAAEIREMILKKLKTSKAAGLGDDEQCETKASSWNPNHLKVLRDIKGVLEKA
jgi:uncharacterized membrane protein YdbT with pleckstrin-like domain